ncbi:MAG: hypothetical protein AAB663_00700 [Patescibacteria group bacterium]
MAYASSAKELQMEPYRSLRPGDYVDYSYGAGRLRFDIVYMNDNVEERRNHHRTGLFNHSSAERAAKLIAESHNLGIEEEPQGQGGIFRFVPARS